MGKGRTKGMRQRHEQDEKEENEEGRNTSSSDLALLSHTPSLSRLESLLEEMANSDEDGRILITRPPPSDGLFFFFFFFLDEKPYLKKEN